MAQGSSGEQIKWIVRFGVVGLLSVPVVNAGWASTQGLWTKSTAPHVWISDFMCQIPTREFIVCWER